MRTSQQNPSVFQNGSRPSVITQKPPIARSNGFKPSASEPQFFDQLGKGVTQHDSEVKVEKAIIELDEMRTDIEIQKNEELLKSERR